MSETLIIERSEWQTGSDEIQALSTPSSTLHQSQKKKSSPTLVERARDGDQEAFNELVRPHVARALGWISSMTKDTYLAEDIIQDALIRAFLHLGTLSDANKFVPWLNQIMRNQTYMKMRRGGPFGKELPFTCFNKGAVNIETPKRNSDEQQIDWTNIDQIFFHLTKATSEEAQEQDDPAEILVRQEMLEGLHTLFRCLSQRERRIFEAHFFGELSPNEIASLFNTTTANVYNTLSRSRAKMQRERIRISVNEYVQKRTNLGRPRKKILPPPPDM